MNCTITTFTAPGNGFNAKTIIGIVYGTFMLTIASTQLFFEYQKYCLAGGNGE